MADNIIEANFQSAMRHPLFGDFVEMECSAALRRGMGLREAIGHAIEVAATDLASEATSLEESAQSAFAYADNVRFWHAEAAKSDSERSVRLSRRQCLSQANSAKVRIVNSAIAIEIALIRAGEQDA